MNHELYKQTLEDATVEMKLLLQERRIIEERIAALAPLIEYLAPFCDQLPATPRELPPPPNSIADVGLSDAIRLAFKAAVPNGLSPTEVRDKLRQGGFNLDKYASEMAPIHNTISRMLRSGEIQQIPREGDKAYRWVSSLTRALSDLGTLSDMNPKNEFPPPPGHAARPKGLFARARERAEGKLSDMNSTLTPPPKSSK